MGASTTSKPYAAFGAENFADYDEMELQPASDLVEYLREYARQHPDMAALCCFAVGFFLGWKLKPW